MKAILLEKPTSLPPISHREKACVWILVNMYSVGVSVSVSILECFFVSSLVECGTLLVPFDCLDNASEGKGTGLCRYFEDFLFIVGNSSEAQDEITNLI